jgi:hypothetical protein
LQSIGKTYEQIVKRLQEDRVGFDNQLVALERTVAAKGERLCLIPTANLVDAVNAACANARGWIYGVWSAVGSRCLLSNAVACDCVFNRARLQRAAAAVI